MEENKNIPLEEEQEVVEETPAENAFAEELSEEKQTEGEVSTDA